MFLFFNSTLCTPLETEKAWESMESTFASTMLDSSKWSGAVSDGIGRLWCNGQRFELAATRNDKKNKTTCALVWNRLDNRKKGRQEEEARRMIFRLVFYSSLLVLVHHKWVGGKPTKISSLHLHTSTHRHTYTHTHENKIKLVYCNTV